MLSTYGGRRTGKKARRRKKREMSPEAREKKNQRQRDKRKRWQAENRCVHCGTPLEDYVKPGTTSCARHYFEKAANKHLGDGRLGYLMAKKFKEQNRLCVYMGIKLVLGDNFSVDHKVPLSRGGKRNDIDNLQFVTKRVNTLKGNSTHEEFLAMCCRVAMYAGHKLHASDHRWTTVG